MKYKTLCKTSFSILLSISFLYDILQDIFSLKDYFCSIKVSPDYINYIFSSAITVGVLGITLMSIAISSISRKYLGIEIKDILSFKSSPINMTTLIRELFFPLFISIPFFFLDYLNSLTILLLFLIVYIALNSFLLWDLVISDEKKEKVISLEIDISIKSGNEEMLYIFIKLLSNHSITAAKAGNIDAVKKSEDYIQKILNSRSGESNE